MPSESSNLSQFLLAHAGALVVEKHIIRHVLRAHLGAGGLLDHDECCALSRDELIAIEGIEQHDIPWDQLPERLVLVSAPSSHRARSMSDDELTTMLWRRVVHGRVHAALEQAARDKQLTPQVISKRIEQIGRTAYLEACSALLHDKRVLPPADEFQTYTEFVSTFLELYHYEPSLLIVTFPGLGEHAKIASVISQQLDLAAILTDGRPDSVIHGLGHQTRAAPERTEQDPSVHESSGDMVLLSNSQQHRALRRALRHEQQHATARAIVGGLRATRGPDKEESERAKQLANQQLEGFVSRLMAVLGASAAPPKETERWRPALEALAHRAAAARTTLFDPPELRLLLAIDKAIDSWEHPPVLVDVPSWIQSFGKRHVVRSLETKRHLLVARTLAQASTWMENVRLPDSTGRQVSLFMSDITQRAEQGARKSLNASIQRSLDTVGLKPRNAPERLGRYKLVEELLDLIIERGYLTFANLRDAMSRNELKLDDIGGARGLIQGDPLLRLDRELATRLDGIYRRADVYLRVLQKSSATTFGTRFGRAVTLYALLPIISAFVLVEGVAHMAALVGVSLEGLTSVGGLAVVAIVMLALLHSAPFRGFAWQVLELTGVVMAWVFLRIPRAVLSTPAVRQFLARPTVRLVLRRVVVPTGVGAIVYLVPSWSGNAWWLGVAATLGSFVVASLLMGSRVGQWVEAFLFEYLAPSWEAFSREWLPGALRAIADLFSRMSHGVEAVMARVDEMVRVHRGRNPVWLVLKGGLGLVWAVVAYFVRLYFTLMIEPEANPLKHFPVATVAHKLLLPFTPQILAVVSIPFQPLGTIIGGTLAAITVFLLPSSFAFLAWELKENYKLYEASLPRELPPTRFGSHGETVRGMLVPGFHSGTIPKTFDRLRRAAAQQRHRTTQDSAHAGETEGLATFREHMAGIERAVRKFVRRELCVPMERSAAWTFGPLLVAGIQMSPNRLRIQLVCEALAREPMELLLEHLDGHIVASMTSGGFLDPLRTESALATLVLENAIASWYQRAEVDIVREQLEGELGVNAHYELREEELVLWQNTTRITYQLNTKRGWAVVPRNDNGTPVDGVPVIDLRRVMFKQQRIAWAMWAAARDAAERGDRRVPRLLPGQSVLAAGSTKG